jgi:peptidoglycan/xylan/chitin deacetylase (PgdA/CDA1 family)
MKPSKLDPRTAGGLPATAGLSSNKRSLDTQMPGPWQKSTPPPRTELIQRSSRGVEFSLLLGTTFTPAFSTLEELLRPARLYLNAKAPLFQNICGEIEVDERLRPAWATKGQGFRIRLPAIYRSQVDGESLADFVVGNQRMPLILWRNNALILNFDPERTVRYLLEEQYFQPQRPSHTYLPFHHHYIPGCLRRWFARLSTARQRRHLRKDVFPTWPKAEAVELVRSLLSKACQLLGRDTPDPTAIWPEGKRFAVSLCHDVDSARGLSNAERFTRLEQKYGMVSAWYVVPRRCASAKGQLRSLLEQGHEIGCHGYDHRNRTPYLPPELIEQRLAGFQDFFDNYQIEGYRSPGLLRTASLYKVLPSFFGYDSSVPDTEWFTGVSAANGCCTVFPFWRDGILILPLTVPQDALLIHYGYKPAQILEEWIKKIEWIEQVGGLAMVTTHPEDHYSARPEMLRIYGQLLSYLATKGHAWLARPVDIGRWWEAAHSQAVVPTRPPSVNRVHSALLANTGGSK